MSGDLKPIAESTANEIYRVALESSPCAMVVVDAIGRIALVNRETERLFGYREGELIGQPVGMLIPESSRENHSAYLREFRDKPQARPMGSQRDLLAQRYDGSVFPVEIGLNPIHTSQGMFVAGAIVDLSQRKRVEQQIREQAEMLEHANARLQETAATDGLTSLWNRRAFIDQLQIQLEQAARSGRPVSVLIVDVDDFKPYNDRFGHLAGDEVLKGVAEVMRAEARRSDYVARIGGEEFGIILPETDHRGCVQLAERFRGAIEAESWPRREIRVSIGATTVVFTETVPRPESPTYSAILSAADKALYYSKENGRNRVTHAGDMVLD